MHRRFATGLALVLALVGGLLVGAPGPAAAARPVATEPTGPTEAAPTEADDPPVSESYARRLRYDLHNDGDPAEIEVTRIVVLYLIERHGQGVGRLIEGEQRSPSGRGATVDDLYAAVLRRAADPDSRAFFIDRLGRIGRPKVMADLLASSEYWAFQGGADDGGWLDALYRDALGRPADPAGRQYFLQQMAGGRTRGSIASFFTGGAEGRTALVRRLMAELLRRPGDPASVAYYAGRLAAGVSVERVVALIAGSAEYLAQGVAAVAPAVDAVLLHQGNQLQYRRLTGPAPEVRRIGVTGLAAGDELVAIDIRPATAGLYGVTEGGQVVAITPAGAATPVGPPLSDLDPEAELGLDVDPATDMVVVTSGAGVHQIDPDTGDEIARILQQPYGLADRNARKEPTLSDSAFTDSARTPAAPATTTAYAVDAETDALVTHDRDGVVRTVGPLHTDMGPRVAFDIAPDAPHAAYAVLTAPRTGLSLWRLDLATGEPRYVHTGHVEPTVIGLAVVAAPDGPSVEPAYGITPGAAPQLRRITTTGGAPTATWAVTGVAPGTDVVGLDVRPSIGGLYGIGSDGQVYGLSAPAGSDPVVATPLGSPLPGFVVADGVGFEVETGDDAVRVVNGTRSYRVRITDGAVVGDGATSGTPGTMTPVDVEDPTPISIDGTASTHAQRGAPVPTEGRAISFHLELAHGGRLLHQMSSGPLEVLVVGEVFPGAGDEVTEVVGFDISPGYRNIGYALLEVDGIQTIATIDLRSGAARHVVDLSEAPARVYSAFALA